MKALSRDVVDLVSSYGGKRHGVMKVLVDREKLRREGGLCYTCGRAARGECGFPKANKGKPVQSCAAYERAANTESGRPEIPVEVMAEAHKNRGRA